MILLLKPIKNQFIMKKPQNSSNTPPAPKEFTLTFTYPELLALNKLLGKVNGQPSLSAEDLHMFTLSPLIASANKKIHRTFLVGFREDLKRKNINYLPKEVADSLNVDKDFQLKKYGPLRDAKKRFEQLEEENKQYIRTLEGQQLRDYCILYYAPFIPTEAHIEELCSILKAL